MNPNTLFWLINIVLLLFVLAQVWKNPRLAAGGKLLWSAFIIVIPLVGSIAYIFFGNGMRRGPRRPWQDRSDEWER